jgi:hypothetical protein
MESAGAFNPWKIPRTKLNAPTPSLHRKPDQSPRISSRRGALGVLVLDRVVLRRKLGNVGTFEHIVPDNEESSRLADSIRDNPRRWSEDPENPARPGM